MALRVWLPLNGTLENKGVSNVNATLVSGNTWATSGKIGNKSLTLTKLQTILPTSSCMSGAKQISYCYWVKVNTSWSTNWLDGIRWIETNGSATGTARQEFYTNCTLIGTWYKGGSISGKSFTPGAWTHLAATINYNTGEAKFYINGILTGSTNNVDTTYYCRGDFYIGDNGVDINENDVRIYDHCLSAAEVHEISQGLVLHYKLDSFQGGFGNPNLGNTSATYSNQQNGVEINASGWGGDAGKVTYYHSGGYAGLPYKVYHKTATGSGGIYYKTANDIVLEADTTYTMSIWIKASREFSDSAYNFCINRGSDNRYINYGSSFAIKTEWTYYTKTFTTPSDGAGSYGEMSIIYNDAVTDYYIYFSGFKIEKGSVATAWCPPGVSLTQIQDSSGYGHNGSILNAPTISSDTGKYSSSLNLNGTTDGILIENLPLSNIINTEVTYSFWIKPNGENGARSIYFGSYSSASWSIEKTTGNVLRSYWNGSPDETCSGATITDGIWQHVCITKKGTSDIKVYINGVQKWSSTATHNNLTFPTTFRIGRDTRSSDGTPYKGLMSDFRIYCTALSADDIKQLYQVGAKVDNLGGLHTFEAVENIPNIIFKIDSARGAKIFQNGLGSYTQANCQVTLTNNGYRIYRPPNLTTSANGNTMWGGLKLVNQTSDTISAYTTPRDNCWNLQQNHTYLCAFHAKGQSSNGTTFSWTNNMGWGGGGVSPSPTIVINDGIPNDFQGEKECIFIFTIGDTLSKTCTTAYASYVAGTTYLSYRHLTFGWGYTSTGSLGTDLYLTNLRLYDITNFIGKIKKTGQANFSDFVENNSIARILKNSEFLINNLIER